MEVDWGCNYIVKNKHFIKSKMILEIGGGDFSRAIAIAERNPEKTVFSIDFSYSKKAIKNVKENCHLPNLNIIKGNATNKIFAEDTFDFVFSIDVGEHIPNLSQFISELSRIIKYGGVYYFIQNPFWTSIKGHHYKHWVPAVQKVLSGYRHIIYDKEQMLQYLFHIQCATFDPLECVARIYDRYDLSRMSSRETRQVYENSDMEIESWENIADDLFDLDAALAGVEKHRGRYVLDDFKTKAAIVTCINRHGGQTEFRLPP